MSETVHYRGTLTKVDTKGKTVNEYATEFIDSKGIGVDDYYDSPVEHLVDDFYEIFYYHKPSKTLYLIKRQRVEIDEDIIKAERLDSGVIEFELKYYNGGAGFEECLDEAIENMQ